ncbi:hypothetical protein BV375_06120 [Nostoc sp. 106C]|nr:hypothetical protein BV375_06120 [Nostoc sp. 106C]
MLAAFLLYEQNHQADLFTQLFKDRIFFPSLIFRDTPKSIAKLRPRLGLLKLAEAGSTIKG